MWQWAELSWCSTLLTCECCIRYFVTNDRKNMSTFVKGPYHKKNVWAARTCDNDVKLRSRKFARIEKLLPLFYVWRRLFTKTWQSEPSAVYRQLTVSVNSFVAIDFLSSYLNFARWARTAEVCNRKCVVDETRFLHGWQWCTGGNGARVDMTPSTFTDKGSNHGVCP